MKSWTIYGMAAVVALAGSPSSADNAAPTGPATAKSGVTTASKETVREPSPRLLSLEYVNAEVTDVIRALSAQSGVNVAVNPNVKGQVTVHLRGKTVDEAMVMVANLAGLGARKVSDTFVVAPRAEMRQTLERLGAKRFVGIDHIKPQEAADLAQGAFPDLTARPQGKGVTLIGAIDDLESAERLLKQNDSVSPDDEHVVEKVALKHIKAAQAAAAIVKMESGLTADVAGSDIVLSGSKGRVDAGKRAMALIDVQAPPSTETRIYNIRYGTAAELAIVLDRAVPSVQVVPGPQSMPIQKVIFTPLTGQFAGTNSQQSSQTQQQQPQGMQNQGITGPNGTTQLVNPNALTLIVTGKPEDVDQAFKVLALADVAPQQVKIEAKVVETSPSLVEDYGVKWNWDPFQFLEGGAGTTGSGGTTRPLGFGAFSRVPWSFTGVLSAMITKGDAKLLASPNVTVVNDQDASVFIGDTLRFQSLAQSSPTTGNQFTVVEVPVGIVLMVHPRINDDGNVTMRVHPVVSTVTGLVNGLPQTSSREAETVVRAKDGETLVIGGLIRDEDIRTMQKVPLLGDLPLIGNLFRATNRNHRRTEVMVVLTIKVLK
jgi:type II secretory pathway component GspD/PulD (secretin)